MTKAVQRVVLLVVKDLGLRRELGRAILRAGLSVVMRRSRDGAVQYIDRHRPALILLDMEAAGEAEMDVLSFARELDPRLRVVVMGPAGDSAREKLALGLGARDYLAKPVSLERLEAALLLHMARGAAEAAF
jgi:DNA-binding NtrC family response regulator